MMDNTTVWVGLSCNNHNNGNFAGEVDAIYIHAVMLQAESFENPLPMAYTEPGTVVIDDATYMAQKHKPWVGNWCWNVVSLSPEGAAMLAANLRKAGWNCAEADSELFEAWHDENADIASVFLRCLAGDGD